jgi:hypothetical protein
MAVLNFPGSPTNGQIHTENGVSYRYDTTVGAWLIYPGGSPETININEVEIDFGSVAIHEKKFGIADANVSSNTIVVASQSFKAATGKSQDENEADSLILSAYANNGYVNIYARAIPGPVIGVFKINYYTN